MLAFGLSAWAELPSQRVGLPLVLREVYLPGGEVKPLPRRDREQPVSIRILDVRPAKEGFRYDFEIQGFEPGDYHLADFLETSVAIEAIPFRVTSGMPPGLKPPHEGRVIEMPEVGGYRTRMALLAALWLVGLVAILLWKRRRAGEVVEAAQVPASLAERLRPILDRAAKGDGSAEDRAQLERLILAHWRERRPEWAQLPPAELLPALRRDAEAAPLLLALERWLHAPTQETSAVEIESLLAPYRA